MSGFNTFAAAALTALVKVSGSACSAAFGSLCSPAMLYSIKEAFKVVNSSFSFSVFVSPVVSLSRQIINGLGVPVFSKIFLNFSVPTPPKAIALPPACIIEIAQKGASTIKIGLLSVLDSSRALYTGSAPAISVSGL